MNGNTLQYVRMFNRFFNKGAMAATYKPIFLRSLLDLGDYDTHGSNNKLVGKQWIEVDGDTVTLDLNFIAVRFLRYCWDLEHSFKLKQSSNPNTSATIVSIIRQELRTGKHKNPPSFATLASKQNEKLRSKVIQESIKPQVLKYLLTDMPGLYVHQKRTNKIKLDTNLIPFMNKHRTIIKNGINYKLTLCLETFNKSAPNVAMKVDQDSYPSRKLSAVSEEILDFEQGHRCFYCDRSYEIPKRRHIDHVIPFNYIFSTDAYNCVAACIRCNSSKSDRLPRQELFDDVLDRNTRFLNKRDKFSRAMRHSFSTYDQEWYKRTYDNCKTDYHVDSLFFEPVEYAV